MIGFKIANNFIKILGFLNPDLKATIANCLETFGVYLIENRSYQKAKVVLNKSLLVLKEELVSRSQMKVYLRDQNAIREGLKFSDCLRNFVVVLQNIAICEEQ